MPGKNLRIVLRLIRGKQGTDGGGTQEAPDPSWMGAGEGRPRILKSWEVERVLYGQDGQENDAPSEADLSDLPDLPDPDEFFFVPGLTTLHHRFAAIATAALGRLARARVDVCLAVEGVFSLDAFLRALPLPLDVDILALPPLSGRALLACDAAAGRGLAAALLGGRADALELGRDSTAVEQALLDRVFRLLRRSYEQAWQHALPVFVRSVAQETRPSLSAVSYCTEIVHVAQFEASLDGATGHVWLCLPWDLLGPVSDRLDGGDIASSPAPPEVLAAACRDLAPREAAAVVAELDPGMAVAVLEQMAPAAQKETLALLPEAGRERVTAFLERSRAAVRAFGPEERLAVALLALGEERAAELLRRMEVKEAATLLKTLPGLGWVRPDEVAEVIQEGNPAFGFAEGLDLGGEEQMARLAKAVFDPAGGLFLREVAESPGAPPFARLAEARPKDLARLLRDEQPATLAAALFGLAGRDARVAGKVLLQLPGSVQAPALLALAGMREPALALFKELENALTAQLLNQGVWRFPRLRRGASKAGSGPAEGMDAALEVLAAMDQEEAFRLLGAIEALQMEIARELRARLFVFEDLALLPGKSIREILKEVGNEDLTYALKGASEKVRAAFYTNLSERAAWMIAEDMDTMGPVRLQAVEDAQTRILRLAWRLSEEGRVLMWGQSK